MQIKDLEFKAKYQLLLFPPHFNAIICQDTQQLQLVVLDS